MTNEQQWTAGKLADAVIDRRISRREFVGRGLKIGLSIPFMGSVLAACGSDSGSSTISRLPPQGRPKRCASSAVAP